MRTFWFVEFLFLFVDYNIKLDKKHQNSILPQNKFSFFFVLTFWPLDLPIFLNVFNPLAYFGFGLQIRFFDLNALPKDNSKLLLYQRNMFIVCFVDVTRKIKKWCYTKFCYFIGELAKVFKRI